MANKHELPIPDSAQQDPSARELVRVWAARGAQHVTLATGLWRDPGTWGIVLADLARHVARAYEQTGAVESGKALDRIREAFEAEWSHPTDEPTGGVED
jgi:hypothetical protein